MKSTKDFYSINDLNSYTLDTIFRLCPDGIVCKDRELRYISVNKCYCNMFTNLRTTDLLGKYENIYIPQNSQNLIHSADNEIKNTLYPINYVINIDNDKILHITSTPIVKDDIFLGIISIVKDITQEENLKENFVNLHFQHINKEKQLEKQRETFVASVSHDLKNPTIAQIRSVELLLKGTFGELNNSQTEILEMILDSCRYMNGMISTLLTTYRNGNVILKYEEFSFYELTEECISEMVYIAKNKDVTIKLINLCKDDSIFADKIQIKRVIMNLLSNGIKYAFQNTDLNIKICNKDKNIGFEFENCSPYIPEKMRQKLFGRYISFADRYKELGVGLGLYTSQKIINAHRGKLYVHSFADDRNIFGFEIPAQQQSEQPVKILF